MLPTWALGTYGVTSATAPLRGGFIVFVQEKHTSITLADYAYITKIGKVKGGECMKRTKTHILLCILLCLSLVSVDALPLFANCRTPSSLPSYQAVNGENKSVNGEYIVSVLVNGRWEEAGGLGYNMFLEEKNLDLSGYLADNSPAAVKLIQEGGEAAHLDSVILGGEAPESVNFNDESLLGKLSKEDLDLTNVSPEGIELVFPANRSSDILSVVGRIEGEKISQEPFKFPSSNTYKKIDMGSEFYTYELNSVSKDITIDGNLEEIEGLAPFFKEHVVPGTGHPEGYIYGWVMNTDEALNVVLDVTPDNTMDGDKDYAKVYVKTGTGVREFKVSVPETTWGEPEFTYTDKVGYQHKVYEFKIPFGELGIGIGDSLQLAFSAYGTMAPPIPIKDRFHPALAFDPAAERYLMVYSNLFPSSYNIVPDESQFPCSGIVGQFVNKDAEEIGEPFHIGGSNEASIDVASPNIAYGNGVFLVAWLEEYYPEYITSAEANAYIYGQTKVVGRLFDNAGNALDESFDIGYSTSNVQDYSLSIAYDGAESFLVTWTDEKFENGAYRSFINGRIIPAEAFDDLPEPVEIYTDDGSYEGNNHLRRPSAAYSSDYDEFLVAWSDYNDEDSGIYGLLLDNTGQPAGPAFVICDDENIQSLPSVAYDETAGKFLVTWCDRGSSWADGRILGSYVDNMASVDEIKVIMGRQEYGAAYEYSSTLHNDVSGKNVSLWFQYDRGEYPSGGSVQFSSGINSVDSPIFVGLDDYDYNNTFPYLDAAINSIDGTYVVAYPIETESPYYEYDVYDIKLMLLGEAVEEDPGTLQFSQYAYEVDENEGSINITVTRTDGDDGSVTVDYRTIDDTASAGEDYTAANGTLTFADGDTEESFTIIINDDSNPEDYEYVALELSNPTNGAELGYNDYAAADVQDEETLTSQLGIIDDDTPNVRFGSSNYSVDEGNGFAAVTVKFSGLPAVPEVFSETNEEETVFAVVYESIDEGEGKGTATVADDYTAVSGIMEFGWGENEKTFNVPIIDDGSDEPNETVNLKLSFHPEYNPYFDCETGKHTINIGDYEVILGTPNEAALTITDNDNPPPSEPRPKREKKEKKTTVVAPPPVIVETPPPTEGLPNDALVDRMPGYVALSTPTKINEVKNEINLSYNTNTLASNPGHDARIYYWRPEVKKWVALATYPDGDGKVKAINDGGYKGWFVVFGVVQPHFSDVSSSWAEQLINRMNGLGLIEGYEVIGSDLRAAKPEQKVTRAEFTMFVTRIMNMNPDNILLPNISDSEIESILSQSYTDAAEITPWVRAAAAKATKAGLVPFEGSSFKPLEPITRIEAAVMVSRALKKFKDFKTIDLTNYKDSGEIPGWAVGQVVENVIEGYPDNTMKPKTAIARAESLAMLMRLFIKGLGW